MNSKILLFFSLVLIFNCISCTKSHSNLINKSEINIPFYIDCNTYQHNAVKNTENTGVVVCDGITFRYEIDKTITYTPISIFESFRNSFYSYHYSKFLASIYIEEELMDFLKDSIEIIEVLDYKISERYIVDCPQCNGTAKLRFNDRVFLYPFNINKEAKSNETKYDIETITINEHYYKKTFISDGFSGILIASKKINNKHSKSLIVYTNTIHNNLVTKLESIGI